MIQPSAAEGPAVFAVLHHPPTLAARSAFPPLIERLGARPVYYSATWERLCRRSWTVGYLLRRLGNRYYGSTWNAMVPVLDDWRLLERTQYAGPHIVHFLWGEFATPKWPGVYRRRGARLIGTFHCSARRQSAVMAAWRTFREFEWITVVSGTQLPLFLDRGYPEERLRVIPLGVDTDYFRPAADRRPPGGPLKGILVGNTERDHEFLAEVLRRLPAGVMDFSVCTAPDNHSPYRGVPGVKLQPHLPDEDLVRLYQAADVMVMPMLDCTANDAMLEAMACGTPVMTNRVGGVPEYVDEKSSFIMDGKNADEWVDRLTDLARNKDRVAGRRAAVRQWAGRFSWSKLVADYRRLYDEVLRSPPIGR